MNQVRDRPSVMPLQAEPMFAQGILVPQVLTGKPSGERAAKRGGRAQSTDVETSNRRVSCGTG
jgi:hypothetical protein